MLHPLHLSIPNVYLLTGDQAILIDSGGPDDVPRVLAFLKEHGIDKLSLILLTHGHWDHAGGAAALRIYTKAPLAIQRGDVELVRHGSNGILKPTCLMAYAVRAFINHGYPPFEPDIVIDEELALAPFGVAGRIVFTPGHTPGSISVLTGEREAIVGDLLMGGWFGGAVFPSWPGLDYFADDLAQMKQSIGKVLTLAPRIIHTGHGGPLEPRDVAQFFGWQAQG